MPASGSDYTPMPPDQMSEKKPMLTVEMAEHLCEFRVEAARREENEACAKVVRKVQGPQFFNPQFGAGWDAALEEAAAAIRARVK
jgi:hypothetical protein